MSDVDSLDINSLSLENKTPEALAGNGDKEWEFVTECKEKEMSLVQRPVVMNELYNRMPEGEVNICIPLTMSSPPPYVQQWEYKSSLKRRLKNTNGPWEDIVYTPFTMGRTRAGRCDLALGTKRWRIHGLY